jgi:hypothetical protein
VEAVTPEAVAWLREQVLARRDKAQAAAEASAGGVWFASSSEDSDQRSVRFTAQSTLDPRRQADYWVADRVDAADAEYIAANDPRDVIARCEAELGILDLYDIWKGWGAASEVAADAVRHLAGGYRHSDGWAEHWGSEVRA